MVSSNSLSLLESFLFQLKELDPSQLFQILCFRYSFLLKCTVNILEQSSTKPVLRFHLLSAFGYIYFTRVNKFSETGRMPKIFERSTAPARLSTWLSVPRRRRSFTTQVSQPGRRLTFSDSSKLGTWPGLRSVSCHYCNEILEVYLLGSSRGLLPPSFKCLSCLLPKNNT